MENNYLKEQVIRSAGINPLKCMGCGKCSATCPSYDNMEYHPHQFVSMVANGNIEPLLESESLYTCLSCLACLERCPRGVEPVRFVEAVVKFRQGHLCSLALVVIVGIDKLHYFETD